MELCNWLRLRNIDKKVIPFLLLENSRSPISTVRAPDPFLLLVDPGHFISLPRNWLSQRYLLASLLMVQERKDAGASGPWDPAAGQCTMDKGWPHWMVRPCRFKSPSPDSRWRWCCPQCLPGSQEVEERRGCPFCLLPRQWQRPVPKSQNRVGRVSAWASQGPGEEGFTPDWILLDWFSFCVVFTSNLTRTRQSRCPQHHLYRYHQPSLFIMGRETGWLVWHSPGPEMP